jgi:hypothetical protein
MGNDTEGNGTRENPFKTLTKAAEQAKATSFRVYACGEVFTGEEVLLDGVSLFGAFVCAGGWNYAVDDQRTTIQPGAGKIPLRVRGTGGVLVENVTAQADAAAMAGGSSISTIVEGGTVQFVQCELYASDGKKGDDGAPHSVPVMPSPAGEKGSGACVLPGLVKGGPGGQATCSDGTSAGGVGGKGGIVTADPGGDGEDGLPTDASSGQGGAGAPTNVGSNCTAGTTGNDGDPGNPGLGAKGMGTISASGYTGGDGKPGTPGAPGQGGGGGGGSRAGIFCSGVEGPGASGGGGGAGGCGGKGGNPGKGGGSSIALISLNAKVTLNGTKLRAGNGGAGGKGGAAQAGLEGGAGGSGGASSGVAGSKAGCKGGDGGYGGDGGPGGGGSGGHSIGIAHRGAAPSMEGVTIQTGSFGPGGMGANASGNGAEGLKTDMHAFQ